MAKEETERIFTCFKRDCIKYVCCVKLFTWSLSPIFSTFEILCSPIFFRFSACHLPKQLDNKLLSQFVFHKELLVGAVFVSTVFAYTLS